MKTNNTRDLAVRLVSQLRSGDQVAALQFGGKVELIQRWTAEREIATHSLKSKLSSGRGGRLKDALAAASVQLKNAPTGNRHIVLVTDGGESLIDKADLAAGMKQLYTASSVDGYYRTNYSALYSQKRASIDRSIAEIQRIYQANFFPEMKTDWQAHPNNIGHLRSSGCFRCHDGEHKSETGKVIRNDCNICHTVLYDSAGPPEKYAKTGPFQHPVKLGDLAKLECTTCHKTIGPFRHPINLGDISEFQCAECHTEKGSKPPPKVGQAGTGDQAKRLSFDWQTAITSR